MTQRDSFREQDLEFMGVRNVEVESSSEQVVIRMPIRDFENLTQYRPSEHIPDWVWDVAGFLEDAEHECCEHCSTEWAIDEALRLIRRNS